MKCNICPRGCNVDRSGGKIGYCGESTQIRVARTSLHQWEEPCITGEHGSGTVFFSGCSLKCIFCQNHNIADSSVGQAFTIEQLADAFLRLQEKKASNINLVTAGHFVKQLVPAIMLAKENGLIIPIVYNSSAYETAEALQMLDGLIDVYLPDCKFYSAEVSQNYAKAADYFKVAAGAIEEMVRQVGVPVFDEVTGNMIKGVIVRHLVLPGHTKDSMEILKYLYDTYKNQIYVSIMNQYTPVIQQDEYPNLNRMVTGREYRKVVDYALSLGMENAFIQEGHTAQESFIPKFDCSFL
ncbi:MAG: 4Fe-4S cluster-binding domain-containing protein [Lachnospiraceae bacterium]|nr:4Fe-4S cluster-binding domain-containing protein [Lachnospiraceae bacterium]